MATSQSSVIRAALKAIFTTAGHTAFAYKPGDTAGAKEYVFFGESTELQEFLDLAGNRMETIDLTGVIRSSKPGANDTQAKAAEDAARTVLASLESSLVTDVTLGGACMQAELVGPMSVDVLADDNSRVALIEFLVRSQVVL
jgi:hypothetical protein